MMLQRLATGATGVKQARYRRRPTRGSEALARACAVYTQPVSTIVCMEGPWHLLFNVRQRMVYMISAEGFALKHGKTYVNLPSQNMLEFLEIPTSLPLLYKLC